MTRATSLPLDLSNLGRGMRWKYIWYQLETWTIRGALNSLMCRRIIWFGQQSQSYMHNFLFVPDLHEFVGIKNGCKIFFAKNCLRAPLPDLCICFISWGAITSSPYDQQIRSLCLTTIDLRFHTPWIHKLQTTLIVCMISKDPFVKNTGRLSPPNTPPPLIRAGVSILCKRFDHHVFH